MSDQEKQRVSFADCYVLTNKRTKKFILSFLEKYLPHRQEYTDTYDIPQFSEAPRLLLKSADELITYLEKVKNEVHAIYWSNKEDATLRGAMCLFTSDGQVILGLYCETLYPDTSIEKDYLKSLMKFCNSTKAIIEYETPAAKDTGEFLKRLETYKHT